MSEHIVPVRIYVTIFMVLLLGTALTVMAAFIDFPWQFNTIIALICGSPSAALSAVPIHFVPTVPFAS